MSSNNKILGYRELSQQEIDLMNEIKAQGIYIDDVVDKLECLPDTDKRWVAIGKTHLQQGIMALVRAVAKPESF